MLDIVNVINVSVIQTPVGLGNYNINNVALFTSEIPLAGGAYGNFGDYVSPDAVGDDWGTGSEAYAQAIAVFSQQPNILAGGGNLIIFPMLPAETLAQAITRCEPLVFFCGIISNTYPTSGNMLALANVVAGYQDKILFLPSTTGSDIAGPFTDIKNATDNSTRCLYYSVSALTARMFAAAAAGRGLSVDFSGANTAITMNLKQLIGISPDEGITQTIYNNCKTAGVDLYTDFAGISAYVSNGANKFFDEVYNLVWFVSQIKVNGFNALLQVGTKIPQTEPGMSYLKSVYRQVCDQGVNNGYVAPGDWNSPEYFGVQADLIANVLQKGYYIFSAPVNLQLPADRQARKSPLVQIAIKEAGAIHSASIVININP
jgi:hypothetical protein